MTDVFLIPDWPSLALDEDIYLNKVLREWVRKEIRSLQGEILAFLEDIYMEETQRQVPKTRCLYLSKYGTLPRWL